MSEALQESYAGGGFGGAVATGRHPALLGIDFVRAYLVPGYRCLPVRNRTRGGRTRLLEAGDGARLSDRAH